MSLKTCGYCDHFDELNRCCWVIAPDGICRNVCESDECHLGFVDEDYEEQDAPNFEFDELASPIADSGCRDVVTNGEEEK